MRQDQCWIRLFLLLLLDVEAHVLRLLFLHAGLCAHPRLIVLGSSELFFTYLGQLALRGGLLNFADLFYIG